MRLDTITRARTALAASCNRLSCRPTSGSTTIRDVSGELDRHADVLLVSAPFAVLNAPSLGLSLLKSCLTEIGVASRVIYPGHALVDLIAPDFYGQLAAYMPEMECFAGEWVFSPSSHERDLCYIADILIPAVERRSDSARFVGRLLRAKAAAPAFVRAVAADLVRSRAKVYGFTSMFQQTAASLAIAAEIKRLDPDSYIVFGGANCEGEMGVELKARFTQIDAVVSGPGEIVFPRLVQDVLNGRTPQAAPGVYLERAARLLAHPVGNAEEVANLDLLPIPDFQDFYDAVRPVQHKLRGRTFLPIETSRGCWWGQKHHCTFCGLNGSGMTFRAKSPQRVLDELNVIARRWPGEWIQAVDNILDHRYFKTVLPALARREPKLELFYEVKANLKEHEIRLLADAGVTSVQPGIESFSSASLRTMDKGVTGVQNIWFLKTCKRFGVHVGWNYIWGFPGEQQTEIDRVAELVPLLSHLEAPTGFGPLRLDRFSPNFANPAAHGFENVRPAPAYEYIFEGVPSGGLRRLAYYFSFDYRQPMTVHYDRLRLTMAKWAVAAHTRLLCALCISEHIVVIDSRESVAAKVFQLSSDCASALRRSAVPAKRISSVDDDGRDILTQFGLIVHWEGYDIDVTIPFADLGSDDQQHALALLAYAVQKGEVQVLGRKGTSGTADRQSSTGLEA